MLEETVRIAECIAETSDLEHDTGMRHRFVILALVWTGLGMKAFACSCAPPPPNATAAQLAEWRERGITAVFEATVESAKTKSPLIDAPVGSIVPASLEEYPPVVSVTFTDARFYKGVQKRTLEVETGLGGGDCGFQFELRRRYLVYAYKDEHGQLSTGICTATASIEESAGNLALLRGERVASDDLRNVRRAPISKLCGRIVQDGRREPDSDTKVMFLRRDSASPVPSDEAELDERGNFCADLHPGNYRLVFTNTGEDSVTSYVYYPGTGDPDSVAEITVNSGQNISDLIFRIPVEQTFSVSGVVSLSNNSKVPDNTKVILLSADRPFQGPAYRQDVSSDGTFILPRVLPGKYWAFLDVDSDSDSSDTKWSTIKSELLVDGNVDHLLLSLIRN